MDSGNKTEEPESEDLDISRAVAVVAEDSATSGIDICGNSKKLVKKHESTSAIVLQRTPKEAVCRRLCFHRVDW